MYNAKLVGQSYSTYLNIWERVKENPGARLERIFQQAWKRFQRRLHPQG